MPQQGETPREEKIRALSEQIRTLESSRRLPSHDVIDTGSPPLDCLLPERGLRRGTLVEWLFKAQGGGVGTLALLAAREACRAGGALVVIDRSRSFYPPGAAFWGIDLRPLIVVRPTNDSDDTWAWDQSLRSPAVAAVWGWPYPRDEQTLRRWQLAAESSGAIGLLLRPESVRRDPSWAELRLLVEPIAVPHAPGAAPRRRLRVELLRARGAIAGGVAELELDEETGRVIKPEIMYGTNQNTSANRMHLATQLAPPAPHRSNRA
jgi:protein ImuA